MIETGRIPASATEVVWTSDPLPNDALAVRKGLDKALVAKVRQLVLAIEPGQAKSVVPAHYTGWVAATHADYKMIEQAGMAVGALKGTTDPVRPCRPTHRGWQDALRRTSVGLDLPWSTASAGPSRRHHCVRSLLSLCRNRPRTALGWSAKGHWTARAWPPDLSELDLLLFLSANGGDGNNRHQPRRFDRGTPLSGRPAQCHAGELYLSPGTSFVFALLFVVAVGLGPFAGVLGIGLHSAGSIAKLWSEAIETVEPGPLEAVAMTGAGRLKSYAATQCAARSVVH